MVEAVNERCSFLLIILWRPARGRSAACSVVLNNETLSAGTLCAMSAQQPCQLGFDVKSDCCQNSVTGSVGSNPDKATELLTVNLKFSLHCLPLIAFTSVLGLFCISTVRGILLSRTDWGTTNGQIVAGMRSRCPVMSSCARKTARL